MRILIGPLEIAGYGSGLEAGFRQLGVTADFIVGRKHPYAYADARFPGLPVKWWWQVGRRLDEPGLRRPGRYALALLHALLGVLVLLWALPRYDVFVFLFGRTYSQTRLDLLLVRLLGKKSLVLFLGSDARPAYMDGARCGTSIDYAKLRIGTWMQKRRLGWIERHADYVVAQVANGQFLRRPYLDFMYFGHPRRVDAPPPVSLDPAEIRIVHSPSMESAKGSVVILAAIERLKEKGYPITLVKLHGVPNSVVLHELARCDFVVDQLYSDSPMATFACEAAHCGRPAVVGGYFSAHMPHLYGRDQTPPSLFVLPEDIEQAIERMIVDAGFRHRLGEAAQRFVREQWGPENVARRYLAVLRGDVDARWWVDPAENTYIFGSGLSRERCAEISRELLRRFGRRSLCLADKPQLEQLVVSHAEGRSAE